jgi:multiple sugar transport system ATP-binding protein
MLPGSRAALASIAREVAQAAQMLDIEPLLARKPSQLSGGQRQRVALGRAMVRHPQAFLMDEPLSNLDAKLRVHMRTEIAQLHRRLGATFVYVTHDQAEAMTMSDRVAVMMDGAILQCDAPGRVYDDPAHLRVAEFIGSPRINVLKVRRMPGKGLMLDGRSLDFGPEFDGLVRAAADAEPDAPTDWALAFRAEHAALGPACSAPIRGQVRHLENLGPEVLVHIDAGSLADGAVVIRLAPQAARPTLGEHVGVVFRERAPMLFGADGVRRRHDGADAGGARRA